jgi:hypothetical protein
MLAYLSFLFIDESYEELLDVLAYTKELSIMDIRERSTSIDYV